MKAKRLVSVLLAVMLLIGMIPMNALAVIESTADGSTKEVVNFEVSLSKTFKGTEKTFQYYDADEGAMVDYEYKADYTDYASVMSTKFASLIPANKRNNKSSETDWQEVIRDYLDKPFQAETNDSDDTLEEVSRNSDASVPDFYIGLKVSRDEAKKDSTYKGILSYTAVISYDSDVVGPMGNSETDDTGAAFRSSLLLNGLLVADNFKNSSADLNYRSSIAMNEGVTKVYSGADGHKLLISMKGTDEKYYFATKQGWDIVIPMKVKAGAAPGKSAIEIVEKYGTSYSNIVYSGDEFSGGASKLNNSKKEFVTNTADGLKHFTGNKVYVDVVSNDATMAAAPAKIPTGKATEVTLTLTGATFKAGAAPTANGATLADFTTTEGSTTATVKVTPNAAGEITINVPSAGLNPGDKTVASGGATAKLTAAEAPAVEKSNGTDGDTKVYYTYGDGDNTLKLDNKTGKSVFYTLKGKDDQANAVEIASGSNKVFAAADLIKAGFAQNADTTDKTYNDLIKVYFAANDAGTEFGTAVPVVQHAKPTATVGYSAEEITFANGVKYKIGDGSEQSSSGAAVKLIGLDAAASGLAVTAYTPGDASGIRSIEFSETYTKAAYSGTLKTDTTTPELKAQGKTVVTGVAAGDEYEVNTSSSAATGTFGDSATGTSITVDASTSQYIWVRTPATSSAFASKPASIKGVGATGGTVEITAPEKDQTEGKLTLTGPASVSWNSSAFSSISVAVKGGETDENGTALTVTASAGSSAGEVKLTFNRAPTPGVTYVLSNVIEALSGGTGNAWGTNSTGGEFMISNKGYDVSFAANSKVTAGIPTKATTVSAGGTKTWDVTVHSYDKITKAEATNAKATASVALKSDNGTDAVYTITYKASGDAVTTEQNPTDTITLTVAPVVHTLTADDFTISGTATKEYDGTATLPADFEATLKTSITDSTSNVVYDSLLGSSNVTVPVTLSIADGAVGTKDVTLTIGTITGTNKDYFQAPTGALTKASAFTISKKTLAAPSDPSTESPVTVDASSDVNVPVETGGSDGPTALANAIKDKIVEIAGVTTDTPIKLEDIFNDLAGKVKTALEALAGDTDWGAAIESPAEQIAGNVVEPIDGSEDTATTGASETATQYAGGEVAVGTPDGATSTSVTFSDGTTTHAVTGGDITISGMDLQIGSGVTPGTYNFTLKVTFTPAARVAAAAAETKTVDVELTVEAAPTDYKYDFSKVADKNLTLELPAPDKGVFDSTSGSIDGSAISVDVGLKMTAASQGGGGGAATDSFTVTYDGGIHGSIISGSNYELVESGNKPAAVPTVKPNDGYTFLGWSRDGKTTIDPTEIAIYADTTYTALYTRGFIQGDGDGKVRPSHSITRAEFTKMLVVASGKFDPQVKYTLPDFTDVNSKAWYAPYIACAVENGIVNGYNDNTFKPTQSINRQEAAQMIYNALSGLTTVETTDKITDFAEVSTWAKPVVATLIEAGIIKGYEDGTFKPKQQITRAEAATMICRVEDFDPSKEVKDTIASTVKSPFTDITPEHWAYSYVMYAAGVLDDSYYA